MDDADAVGACPTQGPEPDFVGVKVCEGQPGIRGPARSTYAWSSGPGFCTTMPLSVERIEP